MTQTWHDLLFAHWPIDAGALREHVPPEFPLDLHDGTAWPGVIPFHITNVAPRAVPSIPWISEFPELSVARMSALTTDRGSISSALMRVAHWQCRQPEHC
jgi:uncharacterized protein YqjF (DUF2071 family)